MTPLPELIRVKLDRARRLQREGDLQGAEKELEEGLEAYPDHVLLVAQRGRLYLAAGRVAEASSLAERLLAGHPGHSSALQFAAEVLMRQGRPSEAYPLLLEADRQAPSAYNKSQMVRSLVKAKQFDEAIRIAEEALRGNPEELHLLRGLEYAYAQSGRSAEAAGICDRILKLAPDDARTTRELVRNRLAALPPAEADAELEALLLVPTYRRNPQLQLLAGERHYKAARYGPSLAAFEAALSLIPGDRYALQQIGFCRYRMGDNDEAIALLEPLFAEDPANRFIRTTLLSAFKKAGRPEDLLALLDRTLASHPEARFLHGIRKKAAKQEGADQA